MSTDRVALVLPQLGNATEEAIIAEWLVEIGEIVKEGEPIVLVETDKATSELPAPVTGRLIETLVEDGEEVQVGAILGWLEANA